MPPATPRQRRSTVSVACNACRHRRSRCDGNRPSCSACEVRGTSCEYASIDSAETHTGLLRRKNAEAESQLDSYQKLFDAMKHSGPVDALRLMTQVRSGADASSILRQFEGGDVRLLASLAPDGRLRYAFPYVSDMPRSIVENRRNPYLNSRILQGTVGPVPISYRTFVDSIDVLDPPYLLPYHTAKLAEPLLDDINASRWTNVTQDSLLVRQLLEIFFLQEHPFLTFFHKDSFLHDMKHGRQDFCSPLLVNSILACAAHGQSDAANRADSWLPQTWTYRFEAEARRLWDIESMEPSLTTVQAGLILSMVSSIDGNDIVGLHHLKQTVAMAHQLDILSSRQDADVRYQGSRLVTAWGLFAWQAITAYHLHQAPLLELPPSQRLPSNEEMASLTGEIWVRYPLSNDLVNLHHDTTFRALMELCHILNDIAQHVFPKDDSISTESTLSLDLALPYRRRLNIWANNLPQALDAEHIVFPSHLKLHMYYHNVLLLLFKPFATAYTTTLSHHHPQFALLQQLPSQDHPLDIVIQAKSSLETLVRLYYLRHGFETWDRMMPQFISSVGFSAVEDLETPTSPDHRREILSTLILCIKGLHDQGKSMYVSEVIYRLLRGRLDQNDEDLVKEFAQIEDDDEGQRRALMKTHVHSAWPIGNAPIGEDVEGYRMGNLVKSAAEQEREADVQMS